MNTGDYGGYSYTRAELDFIEREEQKEAARRAGRSRKTGAATRTPASPPAVMEAVAPLPPFMQDVCKEIARTPYVGDGIKMMLERRGEFRSPTAALLAGVVLDTSALRMFETKLDDVWTTPRTVASRIGPRSEGFDEVVVGGGFHAAIYCTTRVQMGYERPLVLEAADRVGGVFATTRGASFFLNSRNRPGESSVPGQPGTLNALPGAIVQPSDLGGEEYQTDAQMAVAIRTTLAMYADVRTNSRVDDIRFGTYGSQGNRNHQLVLEDGTLINAGRVIIATGLGKSVIGQPLGTARMKMNDRILTYTDFLRRLDRPFPLRGMDKVAVIGGGDSGKTVIEALCGQGPGGNGTVASVDWPRTIDWFGVDQFTKSDFERCNRSRYKGIGRLLPRDTEMNAGRMARVMAVYDPENGTGLRASQYVPGYNCVFVDERPYDYAIICTGFEQGANPPTPLELSRFDVNDRTIGFASAERTIVTVGPCRTIPLGTMELNAYGPGTPNVIENAAAMFRYAQRTSQTAMFLGDPQFVGGFSRNSDIATAKF